MKKLLSSPEVIAAMITVFGTLLVGIILGVAEGKIGFMSLLAVVASVVLVLLLYLLFKRSGPKVTAAAAVIMLVVGFAGFSLFARQPERQATTSATATMPPAPTAVAELPSATRVAVAATAPPQPSATLVATAAIARPPTRTAVPAASVPPPTARPITPAPLPTKMPGQTVAVPDVRIGVLIPPGPKPRVMAIAGDALWVADNQDHRLYQMDRASATTGSFDIHNQDEVYGLAWDGQDLLLALGGYDRIRLVRMSTAGSVLSSVPLPLNVVGLGWNPADSTLWTAFWDQGFSFLVHLTPEGRLIETLRTDIFGGPDGLTCAPDGLWATDAFGNVLRLSYSGAKLAQSDVELGTFPEVSPAIDADGTLLLVSESNRRIYRFSTRLDAAQSNPTPMPDEPGARYLPRPLIEQLVAAGLPSVSFQNSFAGPLTVALDKVNSSEHEATVIQPGQTWAVQVEPGVYELFAGTSGQGMVTLWSRELLVKGYAFTWRAGPEE